MPILVSNLQSNPKTWRLDSRPAPRWELRPADIATVKRLESEWGYSPLVARVLAARGFSDKSQINDFLEPALARIHDPFLLKGMEEAVDRILAAIRAGEAIWIYGDYDVDGVTATAILKSTFDYLNVEASTYIPHRINEGYGLGVESIRAIASQGAKLIITVDNGTTAVEEIEAARSLGIDVIVTDHHETAEALPRARALINPKQAGCSYPFKGLCGAGVAFKLAHGLLRRAAPDAQGAKEFLKTLLDFAALGAIADVVPLIGENRCFVTHGLKLLRDGSRIGLRALLEAAGISASGLQSDNIAFTLAPRINAAGRTGHAGTALELLLASDPVKAREIAVLLNTLNDDRRRIEADITEEAMALINESEEHAVIVLDQEGWHLGVVGIVASRLLERYYRPVIVLGVEGGWAKGSARSIRGFDIHAALTACSDHLEQFGGHTMAAGLRLRADNLEPFRRSINDYARSVLPREQLSPIIEIDAEAGPEDLTLNNIESLAAMGPFGAGNPKVVLGLRGLNLIEEPRILKGKHLKLRLCGPDGRTVHAIGFSMGDRAGELGIGPRNLELACVPSINEWNGNRSVDLEIKDFRCNGKGG